MGRPISGLPRSTLAGRRNLARDAGARPALRPSAARSPAKSPLPAPNRRSRARPTAAFGRSATPGTAKPKICFPRGSRNFSTRRSRKRRRGRRCTRCCAIARAMSCSTIWVCGEDQMGMVIRPDCADLPYFLRAYFAFKMGLPFGYSKCSRGGGGAAPTCHSMVEYPELGAGACFAGSGRRASAGSQCIRTTAVPRSA